MECKSVCRDVDVTYEFIFFDRFRWVSCQLEVLQNCLPQNIRQVLNELPASLDETFKRILREIWITDHNAIARRLLQCLCVAARPLCVEELAEIRALDFDGAEDATPKLIEGHQSKNPEKDVLSICSSLITVVDSGQSRVVQFSHFSVKEYLTSDRLAGSIKGGIYRFHITPEAAHTTLTQACLATLLRLDGSSTNDQVERNLPLAKYASQHWVEHAQLQMRSLQKEDGIQRLFDPTKPYFSTWLWLYNIDDHWNKSGNAWIARGSPLYYASLSGFRDLAEHIINISPEQISATGGRRHSPLGGALFRGHFQVSELLLEHGASVDVTDYNNQTLLQAASVDGRSDVARWLLERGADPNSQQNDHLPPIHLATANGHPEVIQALLEYGVDIHSTDNDGRTPLHIASSSGKVEVVRLLLERGANKTLVDKDGSTPLSLTWTPEVERLLLDDDASPDEGPVLT